VGFGSVGSSSSLLALFDKHFQGISELELRSLIRQVLSESQSQETAGELGGKRTREDEEEEESSKEKIQMRVDLFVLCFHTRWCRGGKGARLPFYQAMKILY